MAYKNQHGFTIVELMIATGVFSAAVLFITMGVIFIGRQFQQASTRVKLEDASREIHQQVGQSVQFSAGNPVNSSASGGWVSTCIGAQRYTYAATAAQSNPTYTASDFDGLKRGLYVDTITPTIGTCSILANPDSTASASNLLPASTTVVKFYYDTGTNTLSTKFISSDSDLLNLSGTAISSDSMQCKGGVTGKEFCAVVQLNSTATRRVNT